MKRANKTKTLARSKIGHAGYIEKALNEYLMKCTYCILLFTRPSHIIMLIKYLHSVLRRYARMCPTRVLILTRSLMLGKSMKNHTMAT